MEQQVSAQDKKGLLQNDRLLVCSMLAFYGICILGLIAATFWGLDRMAKTASAYATSTAFAAATEQANATATAVVRATQQAKYQLVDPFNTNKNRWLIGYQDSEYWRGHQRIEAGVYSWEVEETKKTFISWADFPLTDYIKDFDVYVDTKVLDAETGEVCSGLIFRKSRQGWEEGGYYFALCNNSWVTISYHTEKDGWERIASIQYDGYLPDWNRLEIIARGTHFNFLINGELIYEVDDDRQKVGGLALVMELNKKVSARVMFDNFGYQSR